MTQNDVPRGDKGGFMEIPYSPQSGFEGLTFFGPRLTLIHMCAESELGDGELLARRRIAQWLLTPATQSSSVPTLAALYSATHRRERARHLLFEALALDAKGDLQGADEAWSWAWREWTWLAKTPRPKALAGAPETGQRLTDVLAAVSSELFPVLHLRTYLLGAARGERVAPCHLAFIQRWSLNRELPRGIVALYAQLALALGTLRDEAGPTVVLNFRRLFEERRVTPAESDLLIRGLVRLSADTLDRAATDRSGAGFPGELLDCLELAERTAEPDLDLRELLSLIHARQAVRGTNTEALLAARVRLARALLYDPINPTARQENEAVNQVLQEIWNDVNRELTPTSRELRRQFAENEQELLRLQRSDDARALEDRYAQALRRELTRRLGLNHEDEQGRRLVTALLQLLSSYRTFAAFQTPAKVIDEPMIERIREDASAISPRLARLPWGPLGTALRQLGDARVEMLGVLLPRPAQAPLQAEPSRPSLEGASGRDREVTTSRPARLLALTWLGSSRDALMRVAAVVGLVLGVHALGRMSLEAWRHAREERAYTAVLEAVGAKDDRRVIAQASAFLRMARSHEDDPRARQVAGFYANAVMRELLSATQTGSAEDSAKLLASYEELASTVPVLAHVDDPQEAHP